MYFITLKGKRNKVEKAYTYSIKWEGPSRSKFQDKIKKLLYLIWSADIVFEEFPVLGSRMTLDFYNASQGVAIEVDGDQHVKYTKHFHGKSKLNFIKQLDRDFKKDDFCELNKIKLVRIYTSDKVETVGELEILINKYGREGE